MTDRDKTLTDGRKSASAQEILRREGRPVPPAFEMESRRFLGDADIDFDRYTDQAFFDREMDLMWTRTWQWACREDHIPKVGDYYVYDIGHHSVIVLRDKDMSVKAYVNSCLHRGTKFRPGDSLGSMEEIRCPFHGWTWDLSGELKRIPYDWDVPHVKGRDFSLPKVQVGLWGGFVFINMDDDAMPLAEYLAPIPEHLENFDLSNRFIEVHIEKELSCNWKAAREAFVENYHTQETHPQLLLGSDDEGSQYDVFNDHICRMFVLFGVPSPLIDPRPSEQELVDQALTGNRSLMGDDVIVGEGESARVVMARILRKQLGDAYDTDLSRFTDTEMIDVSQYGIFPNAILFPQLSLPMIYRFRPIGNDPHRTLFELLIMRPNPDPHDGGGDAPPPAVPQRLKEEDSFTTIKGFDPILGHVYDQDTGNLRAQQQGIRAARKKGATLLNYQEVRVRLLHQTLDKYLAEG
ncbi:MAG: aromatic ring-hydroxylating dioxygenase subunit alpha [Alphaproteobacteria bacterium]|nr:MAG: aromatic ring-hydroxylating dioxygenase subunit alpha [Alphaproteobacteria bacterium]